MEQVDQIDFNLEDDEEECSPGLVQWCYSIGMKFRFYIIMAVLINLHSIRVIIDESGECVSVKLIVHHTPTASLSSLERTGTGASSESV